MSSPIISASLAKQLQGRYFGTAKPPLPSPTSSAPPNALAQRTWEALTLAGDTKRVQESFSRIKGYLTEVEAGLSELKTAHLNWAEMWDEVEKKYIDFTKECLKFEHQWSQMLAIISTIGSSEPMFDSKKPLTEETWPDVIKFLRLAVRPLLIYDPEGREKDGSDEESIRQDQEVIMTIFKDFSSLSQSYIDQSRQLKKFAKDFSSFASDTRVSLRSAWYSTGEETRGAVAEETYKLYQALQSAELRMSLIPEMLDVYDRQQAYAENWVQYYMDLVGVENEAKSARDDKTKQDILDFIAFSGSSVNALLEGWKIFDDVISRIDAFDYKPVY